MIRPPLFRTLLFFLLWLGAASSACHAGEPIQVFLAGDSTIAEKLPEKRPETGWGEALQQWFPVDAVVIRNHARNGRSTRTFIDEGLWDNLLSQVQPGDYVLIQFGHNDQSIEKKDRYTPPEQYTANLLRFVANVEACQATAVLITPVVRRRFDENGQFYDVHGEYPDLVREVAAQTGAPLIDLDLSSGWYVAQLGLEPSKELYLVLAPGEFDNYPDGLDDNTHFSPLGAATMASLVVNGILESNLGLAALVVRDPHRIEQDNDVAKDEPGTHYGGGETTGYSFFNDVDNLDFIFRKRELHPGSAIGYHLHDKDEIYYVLSGAGELTMNGVTSTVGPGTAILTRPGDSHGLRQVGDDDLVILIMYEKK